MPQVPTQAFFKISFTLRFYVLIRLVASYLRTFLDLPTSSCSIYKEAIRVSVRCCALIPS